MERKDPQQSELRSVAALILGTGISFGAEVGKETTAQLL